MLTARDAVSDRVGGLDAGADDYLDQAVLVRGTAGAAARDRAPRPGRAPADDRGRRPAARPAAHRVWRGDHEIELSTREFALLELFMRRPGEVLSRLQLLEGAWDMAFESRSNVVDVYVRTSARRSTGRSRASSRDGARSRLPAPRDGGAMSRLPIRLRLTLPFAAAMEIVLAAMGLFIYVRVGGAMLANVDHRTCSAQIAEATSNVGTEQAHRPGRQPGPDRERVLADGTVVDSTPRPLPTSTGRAPSCRRNWSHARSRDSAATGGAQTRARPPR